MPNKAYTVQQIQDRLLDILSWFHGFCATHGLRYYAIGGTLLGAVRHNGFIPWDDDLDVGMPRPDYERFIELAKNNGSRFVAETIDDGNKDFTYRFCKVYDTSTTAVHHHKYDIKRGLFLDVFPLDGVGDTKKEAIKNYKKFKRKDHFVAAKTTYKYDKRFKFYQNAAAMIARALPYSWRRAIKKLHRHCRRIDYDKSVYAGNLFGIWREREIVERNVFGEPKLYPFCGIEIYGPQDADKYLTSIYGDYMTPPPADKQKPSHECSYMDLDEPYMSVEGAKGDQA